ncbi:MAG TPA: cytochrome c-type biogenesis CcmF C-terminal domain-containing protein [Chloroflexota bacterium]|nr:cytochrome c-type biogenesis CcmF C-terminal domain-containing protein [Chloroflexota bacterium]
MTLPDAGAILLMLAFVVAAFGAVAAPLGSRRGKPELVGAGQRAAYASAALLTMAVAILERALLTHDFSLRFVAETTSRAMERSYLVASLWGGQAGSLLYWCWILTLLTALVAWRTRRHYPTLYPDALGALLGTQLFFVAVLALVSSPFERLPIVPLDGRGLNPLLVDDGMRIHPPFLLAGYVTFAVPYAFALAALARGRFEGEFLRAARRWALLSWTIQGTGLLLGAWWAYHVLGWGGYWGWDPVENVALLPWLMATALLHALMVQERRGMMKLWNVVLALAGFCLAVFGTFVVRSGILSSVHAFAQSLLGPFFFGFLGLVLIGSLALVLHRLPQLRAEGSLDSVVSREAAILMNNLLLVGVALATFWGTIFPLLSEALQGVKIAVGPPFYQQVNGPILLGLLVLLGVGPPLGWRRTSRRSLERIFRWPAVAVVVGVAALVVLGMRHAPALLVLGASVLVVGTVVAELVRGTLARQRNGEDPWTAFTTLVARDRRRYGGYLVHVALAVVAVGIVGSMFFQDERLVTLKRGESVTVGAYRLDFDGLYVQRGAGYRAVFADLRLNGPGGPIEVRPERRSYEGWESQPTSGVAIHTSWPRLDDVYVLLAGVGEDGSATLRVFVNPLVILIWVGGGLMLLGVLVTAWPQGARVARTAPLAAPAPRASEAVAGGT